MIVEYDPTTPWKSDAEMLRARQQRGPDGRRLVDVDRHYRECVESKDALGYEGQEGPEVRGKGSNAVYFGKQEESDAKKIVELRKELETLAPIVENQQRDAFLERVKLGGPQAVAADKPEPYASQEQWTNDIKSPQYRKSQEFRSHVDARASVTDAGVLGVEVRGKGPTQE